MLDITMENEELAVGDTFTTWNEFAEKYEKFLKSSYHPIFSIESTTTAYTFNKKVTTGIPLSCGYQKVIFGCIHGKKSKSFSKGIRPKQKSLKINCTAKVAVKYSKNLNAFEITQCELQHVDDNKVQVHEINEKCFKSYNINLGFRALNYMIPRIVWQYDEAENCEVLHITKQKPTTQATIKTTEALLEYGTDLKKCKEYFLNATNLPISARILENKKQEILKGVKRERVRLIKIPASTASEQQQVLSNKQIFQPESAIEHNHDIPHPESSFEHNYDISRPESTKEHNYSASYPDSSGKHEYGTSQPESTEKHNYDISHPESTQKHYYSISHTESSEERNYGISQPESSEKHNYGISHPESTQKHYYSISHTESSEEYNYCISQPDSSLKHKYATSHPESSVELKYGSATDDCSNISQSHRCSRFLAISKKTKFKLKYIIVESVPSCGKVALGGVPEKYSVVGVASAVRVKLKPRVPIYPGTQNPSKTR